jgi:hypothetical protein
MLPMHCSTHKPEHRVLCNTNCSVNHCLHNNNHTIVLQILLCQCFQSHLYRVHPAAWSANVVIIFCLTQLEECKHIQLFINSNNPAQILDKNHVHMGPYVRHIVCNSKQL